MDTLTMNNSFSKKLPSTNKIAKVCKNKLWTENDDLYKTKTFYAAERYAPDASGI